MRGKAIIFSAPSGAGKTTIVHRLLTELTSLTFSISATTRPQRENEQDGVDYYFLSQHQFQDHLNKEELLEWEEVYEGIYYGTLKREIDRIWDTGNHLVFDVDVKGGINLKKAFGNKAISIFIKVSGKEILRERLRKRNTENEASLEMRLRKAEQEMKEEHNFDYVILNENLDKATQQVVALVENYLNT